MQSLFFIGFFMDIAIVGSLKRHKMQLMEQNV